MYPRVTGPGPWTWTRSGCGVWALRWESEWTARSIRVRAAASIGRIDRSVRVSIRRTPPSRPTTRTVNHGSGGGAASFFAGSPASASASFAGSRAPKGPRTWSTRPTNFPEAVSSSTSRPFMLSSTVW
ncbi:MAG: hypothetical protein R3B09_25900 [Nannocystaceae bacterium]